MNHYIAFNGDADGLCAVQQLRLAEPHSAATLVTGVKRDIRLLERVNAGLGDMLTVLDVSLDQNRTGLLRVLEAGASVRYFDHHHAGTLPQHSHFTSFIDEAADVCTSLLVDRYLNGRHHVWAIVAAFGDSLPEVGRHAAQAAGIAPPACAELERLGIYLNYNAYGETIADLHFDPAELSALMMPFTDPFEFIEHSSVYAQLATGYEQDMDKARQLVPARQLPGVTLLQLPDQPWARRAIGVLANERMREQPANALGILAPKMHGGFSVSVRVPADSQLSAAEFCRRFDTGGGRRLAGGINYLPEDQVQEFATSFEACFANR